MNRQRQSAKGNSATVNAKSDSTKKKAQKALIITSARLDTLQTTRVDQILGTILSKAGLTVTLKINADQALISINYEEGGKRACTIADIQRINGFRKFAMDQKKISEASTILDPVLDRFFNAFKMIRAETSMAEFLPPQIQSGPIAAMKDANVIISNLLKNDQALEKMSKVNTEGDSRILIDMMRNWITSTLEIYTTLYIKIVKGLDTKGFLAEALFDNDIPKWAFDKFSRSDLNKIAGQDIRRLFFPIDIRKGIYFTVKELTDEDFKTNCAWLLKNSRYQKNIVNSKGLLKVLSKSEAEISFTNESDPIGTALRSEKVLLTPHWYGPDFNLEPKTKKLSNFCGNPDFSSPRQGLRSVLEFGLALQTGDFKIPNIVEDFLKPLTSKVVDIDFVKNVTAKRNVFKVLHENSGAIGDTMKNLYYIDTAEIHEIHRNLLPLLLRVSVKSEIAKALLVATGTHVPDANAALYVAGRNILITAPKITLLERTRFGSLDGKVETSVDKSLKKDVIVAAALPTSKQIKKTKVQKFSRLTTAGMQTVKAIREEDSLDYLAEPVAGWLQGFTSDVIQNVAADLVVAQFGTLLSTFESDSEADSDENGSDSEEGE